MSVQIKSKSRVSGYGEVYTNKREVNAMLDMIDKAVLNNISSTFLEPACGNGNFLNEVLRSKLEIIATNSKDKKDYIRNCLIAISSIYGIDIQEDNITECRARLYTQIKTAFQNRYNDTFNNKIGQTFKFILHKNIICGNSLTQKKHDETFITICKWIITEDYHIIRYDYNYNELVKGTATENINNSYIYTGLEEVINNERAS